MNYGTLNERNIDQQAIGITLSIRAERTITTLWEGSKIELNWSDQRKASNQAFFKKHVLSIYLSITFTFGASCLKLKDLALSLERFKAKNENSSTIWYFELEERHGRKNSKHDFRFDIWLGGEHPFSLCPSPVLNGIDYKWSLWVGTTCWHPCWGMKS